MSLGLSQKFNILRQSPHDLQRKAFFHSNAPSRNLARRIVV